MSGIPVDGQDGMGVAQSIYVFIDWQTFGLFLVLSCNDKAAMNISVYDIV